MSNYPQDIHANTIQSNFVDVTTEITSPSFGGKGGKGAIITASKINLGGWILEAGEQGLYVTTPEGVRTKMELIDFRETPVPETAKLLPVSE